MRAYNRPGGQIAMNFDRMRKAAMLLLGLTLGAGLAGCRINVDKGANGDQKKVQVDTPFGGVHVNTDQTTAADLGLPLYPGAAMVKDDDNHESADVHLGFGQWELRVRTVSYQTSDSQDKVSAFYKKALGRYGEVITCDGNNAPVGSPAATSEGLTCSDDKNTQVQIDRNDYGTGKVQPGAEGRLQAPPAHRGFPEAKGQPDPLRAGGAGPARRDLRLGKKRLMRL